MALTWFITGASSGIGREVALAALSRGDSIIATSRDPSGLSELRSAGATTLRLDITWSRGEISAVVEEALGLHGKVDILVNVAGYLLEGGVEETSEEEIEQVYRTNVFGPINLARALLPHFRSRRAGVIANVSGIGGLRGAPAAGYFCGTKSALRTVSEALRGEVAPLGISVCCVMPGHFRTAFLNRGHRLGAAQRIGDYADIVEPIKEVFSGFDGKQPGDPVRAGSVIVGVLRRDGGREIPGLLPVGGDAFGAIDSGYATLQGELEPWKEVSGHTDLEGVDGH